MTESAGHSFSKVLPVRCFVRVAYTYIRLRHMLHRIWRDSDHSAHRDLSIASPSNAK